MTATNDASYNNELSAEQKSHETSMDDILASIRRIIADDDALPLSRRARAAAALATTVSTPAANGVAAVSDAFVSLGQRLTRRSAPAEPEASFAQPPVALTPKPPLLKLRHFAPDPDSAPPIADFEASEGGQPPERPASVTNAQLELRRSLPESEKPFEPSSASVVTLVHPSAQAVESRFKIASLAFRAPAYTPAPAVAAEKPFRDDAKAAAPETPAAPIDPPAAETPPPAEEKSEPALLSPASGSRIGASFEALAESLLLRDPRMVERLTREMLRPMLKEWLDDHLPDVVERLVRAEIERVARGGG